MNNFPSKVSKTLETYKRTKWVRRPTDIFRRFGIRRTSDFIPKYFQSYATRVSNNFQRFSSDLFMFTLNIVFGYLLFNFIILLGRIMRHEHPPNIIRLEVKPISHTAKLIKIGKCLYWRSWIVSPLKLMRWLENIISSSVRIIN